MIKEGFDALIASMDEHPDEWTADKYCFTHSSDLQVWLSNGFSSYGIYKPTKDNFSFIQKFRFRKAFKVWRGWNTAIFLSGEGPETHEQKLLQIKEEIDEAALRADATVTKALQRVAEMKEEIDTPDMNFDEDMT